MRIISKNIDNAVSLLSQENIIAIPTETVYGLAGNIYSEKAIKAIFETKQRPFFNPLIVHIADVSCLEEIAKDIPQKAKELANAFWPGPLTLVLPKKDHIPDLITAGKKTVAVRVPDHSMTLALLSRLDFPLAAPSANPFGSISPTKPEHVVHYFGTSIKMVLDGGACRRGIESTIIGFENGEPVLYRLGSISKEAIEATIGKLIVRNKKEHDPDAPGMLERHYAPKTKTLLTTTIVDEIERHRHLKIGVLVFQHPIEHPAIKHQIVLSASGDFQEAASGLYLALHDFDQQDLDLIIAERLPDHDLGASINDRLERATK